MNCRTAIRKMSPLLDGLLRGDELHKLRMHLDQCPECALRLHQAGQLQSSLRSLPNKVPPPELATELRVVLSRERVQRSAHASMQASLATWAGNARLWMHNLMRPLAIPFAGGLASAVILFSMLVPTIAVQGTSTGSDVPTVLTTEAALASSFAFGLGEDDIVVEVLVDEDGRMLDYSVPHWQKGELDPELRRGIENTLVCTRFAPASMFGQPVSGKLRITLRRSLMEVKG